MLGYILNLPKVAKGNKYGFRGTNTIFPINVYSYCKLLFFKNLRYNEHIYIWDLPLWISCKLVTLHCCSFYSTTYTEEICKFLICYFIVNLRQRLVFSKIWEKTFVNITSWEPKIRYILLHVWVSMSSGISYTFWGILNNNYI